jgi:Predicted DNA alkylation repair enzyme
MNSQEILATLRQVASEEYKSNVMKMGIPSECSIGVSTPAIRSLAKKLGKSNELAYELWHSRYHEAKLLAVLLFNKKQLTLEAVEPLMSDVFSWDLCDHLCKNLLIKMNDYDQLIPQWIVSNHIYKRRAAFTLMASYAIHSKVICGDKVDHYLYLISEYSQDTNDIIKKAASWALREIGKIDYACNEKALLTAYELKEKGNKSQVWIAKDALKELETLVEVEGRRRLITVNSQMGKQVGF